MWQNFFDSGWFIFFFPLALLLSVAGGIFYATKYKKRKTWEASGIENSILAVFGLIISFTFLMAGNAHRERYGHIHQEANSLERLYRYSREMPDSFAHHTNLSLIDFLNNQLDYNNQSTISETAFLTRAIQISDLYWAYLSEYRRQNNNPVLVNLLEKISNSFDETRTAFSLQVYSQHERAPAPIMFLLILTSLLIGYLVGFMNGIKSTVHYLVPLIYLVMITLVMIVIRDLNNPLQGLIRPNYYDLNNVYQLINQHR